MGISTHKYPEIAFLAQMLHAATKSFSNAKIEHLRDSFPPGN